MQSHDINQPITVWCKIYDRVIVVVVAVIVVVGVGGMASVYGVDSNYSLVTDFFSLF